MTEPTETNNNDASDPYTPSYHHHLQHGALRKPLIKTNDAESAETTNTVVLETLTVANYMNNLMKARLKGLITIEQYDNIKYLLLAKYRELEFTVFMRMLQQCFKETGKRTYSRQQIKEYLDVMISVLSM
jgi:hypothetical protein